VTETINKLTKLTRLSDRLLSSVGGRPNLSAYLSQQILSMIRERQLRPGDRLPSAKDLAAQFSVATPTMREALRRLQATGIIDMRHGSGIYVRRESERLMFANPAYGTLETQTILQVIDARILIEPHLADLAAGFASKEQIADLQSLLIPVEQALEYRDERYVRANHALHTAIARASGNLVLAQIVESLLEMHSIELHIVDPTSSLAEIRARDHHFHHLIVNAIASGNGAAARHAMDQHLNGARSTLVPKGED
jgi:GntR family transcriptional regulator, transcriptional repressor for pyruvate dehydrogenase complex